MIFVTVGTHEQAFDRLIRYIDELKADGLIEDEVVMQTGFSTYEPKHCKWSKTYPYFEMSKYVSEARIVITHGGPSSFIMPLQLGKIPVVVPRQQRYAEHVNNHQLEFAKEVRSRQGNILVVEDITELKDILLNYADIVNSMTADIKSNNATFNARFRELVDELLA